MFTFSQYSDSDIFAKRVRTRELEVHTGTTLIPGSPVARICRRGVTWVSDVHVYMLKHTRLWGVWGHAPPGKF